MLVQSLQSFYNKHPLKVWSALVLILVAAAAIYIIISKPHQRGGGDQLDSGRVSIKLFKTSTCPHCVDLQPTWDKLCESYEFLDTVQDEQLADYDFVEGVPTIAVVDSATNDLVEEYKGPRTEDAIREFIVSHENIWNGAS